MSQTSILFDRNCILARITESLIVIYSCNVSMLFYMSAVKSPHHLMIRRNSTVHETSIRRSPNWIRFMISGQSDINQSKRGYTTFRYLNDRPG
jgi:hypothetical protein